MQTTKIKKELLDSENYYTGSGEIDGHLEIESNLGWVRFKCNLIVSGSIFAKAGSGIEAGWGIKAGEGIEAGWTILCKRISTPLRIFAGLCNWKIPTEEETEIRCEKLVKGTIAFGKLVETKKKTKP